MTEPTCHIIAEETSRNTLCGSWLSYTSSVNITNTAIDVLNRRTSYGHDNCETFYCQTCFMLWCKNNDIKYSSDMKVSNSGTTSVNQKEKLPNVIQQNLEPNFAEMWIGPNGKVYFKIKTYRSDLSTAVEDTVEQFNRLAQATGRPKIILDQVIVPVVEKNKTITKEIEGIKEWDTKAENMTIRVSPKSFAAKLRKYRKEADYTISALAEKIGVEKEDVLNWEKGKGCPDTSTIMDISECLHLDDKKWAILEKTAKVARGT